MIMGINLFLLLIFKTLIINAEGSLKVNFNIVCLFYLGLIRLIKVSGLHINSDLGIDTVIASIIPF